MIDRSNRIWLGAAVAAFALAFVAVSWLRQPDPAASGSATAPAGPAQAAPARDAPRLARVQPETVDEAPPPPALPDFHPPRLDVPPPAHLVGPAPPMEAPPQLAGAGRTGNSLPVTMDASEVRQIQVERLAGLRARAAAMDADGEAGGKLAAEQTEIRTALAELEVWADEAHVNDGELAAAARRLEQRAAAPPIARR